MTIVLTISCLLCSAYADEEQNKPKAEGWDMVSDTVSTTFRKANALLTGNLEMEMSVHKPSNQEEFTRNAIGQKVPKNTSVKSAGSLHNDEPL